MYMNCVQQIVCTSQCSRLTPSPVSLLFCIAHREHQETRATPRCFSHLYEIAGSWGSDTKQSETFYCWHLVWNTSVHMCALTSGRGSLLHVESDGKHPCPGAVSHARWRRFCSRWLCTCAFQSHWRRYRMALHGPNVHAVFRLHSIDQLDDCVFVNPPANILRALLMFSSSSDVSAVLTVQ